MIRRALLAASLVVATTSSAMSGPAQVISRGDHADVIVMPPDTRLRFHSFDDEGTAKFDGEIELSGTYYLGANLVEDGQPPELTLYLIPDKATIVRLPHFKERGVPEAIYLSNEAAFAKAMMPGQSLTALNKRGGKYASGNADIWADKFEAGIECDAPFFNARFERVVQPAVRVAMKDLPDTGC